MQGTAAGIRSEERHVAGSLARDKPLFSIDAKNMEQYKDRLMEAQMELMRRYPSYRIDIYPTRRSVWMPERFADRERWPTRAIPSARPAPTAWALRLLGRHAVPDPEEPATRRCGTTC
jgi:hypothetical protein